MKCKDFLELISSAVDNQLNENEKLIFNEHLKVCPRCKREYELERVTKSFVSSVCHPVYPPDSLKEKIVFQINNFKSQSIFNIPFLNPKKMYWYLILPISIIVVILIFSSKSEHNHLVKNLSENNLIRVNYTHFDEILAGNQEIAVETSNPAFLETKLRENYDGNISIPHLNNCELIGGWTSEEYGKKIIHTLYKDKDELIYCSQINFNDLLKDTQLYLEHKIVEKLKERGKYIQKDFECCSVILWLNNSQLYVITSEMDTNTLLSHLPERR